MADRQTPIDPGANPAALPSGPVAHLTQHGRPETDPQPAAVHLPHSHGSHAHIAHAPGEPAGAGHSHSHLDLRELPHARRVRVLWLALSLNAGLLVVQLVGGIAFGSLALLADSAHLATDVLGLVVALAAQRLVTRPATDKHSYGLQRAEVLGALSNGVLLLAATAWITYEAVLRFGEPGHIDGTGVTVLGAIGLVVNLVSAIAVARVAGSSLNLRGAWLHLASDAAGSVLAMASGVAVLVWDATLVDPIVSLLLAVLVGILAWRLVRDAAHVLLEGAPGGVTTDAIRELLCNEPGVTDVHHIHLWSLTSEASAMSAHVVLSDEPTLHEAQAIGQRLRAILEDRLDVGHATLELECHACGDADPDHRSGGVS